jgi:hypothetical protein
MPYESVNCFATSLSGLWYRLAPPEPPIECDKSTVISEVGPYLISMVTPMTVSISRNPAFRFASACSAGLVNRLGAVLCIALVVNSSNNDEYL